MIEGDLKLLLLVSFVFCNYYYDKAPHFDHRTAIFFEDVFFYDKVLRLRGWN